MTTERHDTQSSSLTEQEILELRQRVFQRDEERSKARAPIRWMLIGGYVFAGIVGIFVVPFFPSVEEEITRVLLWGLLGLLAVSCAFGWQGRLQRLRERQRIYEEIRSRHQR